MLHLQDLQYQNATDSNPTQHNNYSEKNHAEIPNFHATDMIVIDYCK
jgi:hydroxyacyl-ACP dehydratase HTD2-like protein with hotdog domain